MIAPIASVDVSTGYTLQNITMIAPTASVDVGKGKDTIRYYGNTHNCGCKYRVKIQHDTMVAHIYSVDVSTG